MQKIDIHNLTADDMLDLINEFPLDVQHTPSGVIVSSDENQAISNMGISEAIRSWARKYNEMVEASNG